MSDDVSPMTPGEKVAYLRERAGINQAGLAGRVGKSPSWLNQIERGRRDLDSFSMIMRLADELCVSPWEIAGHPGDLTPPNGRRQHPALPAVRAALDHWPATAPAATGVEAPAELGRLVAEAWRLWQASPWRIEDLGRDLPGLLATVQATVHRLDGQERTEAQRHAALAWQLGRAWLKRVGEFADAGRCADRAIAAAHEVGDLPLIAAGFWNLALVYGPAGEAEHAREVAREAASMLRPVLDDDPTPEALSAYGGVTLVDAIMSARLDDQGGAWEALNRAERTARKRGEGNDFWTVFGPTNVGVWAVAVAADLGQADEALRFARQVDVSGMVSIERRFSHEVEIARAHRQMQSDEGTLLALLQAERVCPSEARHSVGIREMTRALLRREKCLTHRGELRGLARRLGVLEAA